MSVVSTKSTQHCCWRTSDPRCRRGVPTSPHQPTLHVNSSLAPLGLVSSSMVNGLGTLASTEVIDGCGRCEARKLARNSERTALLLLWRRVDAKSLTKRAVRGLSPKAFCEEESTARASLCVSFDCDSLDEELKRKSERGRGQKQKLPGSGGLTFRRAHGPRGFRPRIGLDVNGSYSSPPACSAYPAYCYLDRDNSRKHA